MTSLDMYVSRTSLDMYVIKKMVHYWLRVEGIPLIILNSGVNQNQQMLLCYSCFHFKLFATSKSYLVHHFNAVWRNFVGLAKMLDHVCFLTTRDKDFAKSTIRA